ncbi:Transient receptor potential cation channel protein painlesslike, partial [Caligus rogercresseyi]
INLLECLSSGNLTAFSDALVDSVSSKEDFPLPSEHWINSPLEAEDGKSILILALEKRQTEFAGLLLKFGAVAHHFNESYGLYPIHIASRNGDLEALKLLFRYSVNSADPDSVMRINGRTPLHIMAENNFVEGVDYLLRQKPIADIKDKKGGQTPLFLAAYKRSDPAIVRSLLKYGADPDIKCLGSKTARDLIFKHYDIALDDRPSSSKDSESKKSSKCSDSNRATTINSLTKDIRDHRFPGNMNLIQKICDQDIEDCMKRPISVYIAAQRKSRPILQILADKNANFAIINPRSSEALKFILNDPDIDHQIRSIINKRDLLGNTPLHLAAQRHDQEMAKRLLQLGANIGDVNHDDFELEFDYSFLAPPYEDVPFELNQDDESMIHIKSVRSIAIYSNIPSSRASCGCKWGRIRPFFNRNLRFFMTFVFLTTWYIFETYRTCISVLLSSWFEICLLLLLYTVLFLGQAFLSKALFIVLLCLLFREIMNVAVSIKRYVLSPNNLIQAILIVSVSFLLFDGRRTEKYESLHRHLAGTTIVLSWASLVTLIGKHPKLMRYNVYVTMFYKVMQTFLYFLIWYALFIVAFGLAFYIIFHEEDRETGGYEFFDTPFLSLIKFSDIPIKLEGNYVYFSYVFFLSFVFLIVVVLMNLLNGLAVSDTGEIQEKAETFGYVSRVETISYTESVLLGDPFDFLSNWPKIGWIRHIPSFSFLRQLYRNKYLQKIFHKVTGATGILLFYSFLPDKKLKIRPNEKRDGCPCFKIHDLDRGIISSAKKIVLNRQYKEQNIEILELSAKVDSIMELLARSEKRQELMMEKLSNIENLNFSSRAGLIYSLICHSESDEDFF